MLLGFVPSFYLGSNLAEELNLLLMELDKVVLLPEGSPMTIIDEVYKRQAHCRASSDKEWKILDMVSELMSIQIWTPTPKKKSQKYSCNRYLRGESLSRFSALIAPLG
jgi:hypothetical protein